MSSSKPEVTVEKTRTTGTKKASLLKYIDEDNQTGHSEANTKPQHQKISIQESQNDPMSLRRRILSRSGAGQLNFSAKIEPKPTPAKPGALNYVTPGKERWVHKPSQTTRQYHMPLKSPPVKSQTIDNVPKADQSMSVKVDQSLEHHCQGQFYKAPDESLLKKSHHTSSPLEKGNFFQAHISNTHASLINNSSIDLQIKNQQSSDGKPKGKISKRSF